VHCIYIAGISSVQYIVQDTLGAIKKVRTISSL
jgi:hypothetical protein